MKNIKLFIDTNVMLDLLGEREPFYNSIAQIATLADRNEIVMMVSALSYSTVFYLLSKYENSQIAREKLQKFKTISKVVDLSDNIINQGLVSEFKDFEDSLQYYSALKSGCALIVTRNTKDFKHSKIPVMSGEEYIASLVK